MKAKDELSHAKPGKSTAQIVDLAKRFLKEEGDLPGEAIYRLTMLALDTPEQSMEVDNLLHELRDTYFEQKDKKPPKLESENAR